MMKKFLVIVVFMLSAIPLAGYSTNSSNANEAVTTEKKPLYWIDPMEPNIHYSAPGKSRMGMELEPIYQKKSDSKLPAKD